MYYHYLTHYLFYILHSVLISEEQIGVEQTIDSKIFELFLSSIWFDQFLSAEHNG